MTNLTTFAKVHRVVTCLADNDVTAYPFPFRGLSSSQAGLKVPRSPVHDLQGSKAGGLGPQGQMPPAGQNSRVKSCEGLRDVLPLHARNSTSTAGATTAAIT